MPTNTNGYNSRVTDEALEKRFRDTFRSQGGAELVDDLYAQGVIVPIVDFTAAATGQQLAENLQTAWDFSTGITTVSGSTNVNLITNAGFWLVDLVYTGRPINSSTQANIELFDGSTSKPIWRVTEVATSGSDGSFLAESRFTVFLRSGDVLRANVPTTNRALDVWYRQIATVNGDLVNPTGFTSS
jgi:hypothetical protein